MKLEHLGIMVRDLEKSREFYEELLGFKLVKTVDDPKTGGKMVYLDLGGNMIELIWYPDAVNEAEAVEPKVGIHHIHIFVESSDSIHEIVEALEEKGVSIIEKPTQAIRGGTRAAVYDPDGVYVGLVDGPLLDG